MKLITKIEKMKSKLEEEGGIPINIVMNKTRYKQLLKEINEIKPIYPRKANITTVNTLYGLEIEIIKGIKEIYIL